MAQHGLGDDQPAADAERASDHLDPAGLGHLSGHLHPEVDSRVEGAVGYVSGDHVDERREHPEPGPA